MVFRTDGRVLVIQRGHPPHQGTWTLPGGKVEPGERLRDALVREVREETGLLVEVGELVEVVEVVDSSFHYVVLDYLCELRSDPDDASASDDAAALCWVSLHGLPLLGVTAAVLSVVRKAAPLAGGGRQL